jgi:uncharacterized integral membrane protein
MNNPPAAPGSDEDRARKILEALEKAQPRRARRAGYSWFILLMSLVLVLAIVLLVLTNKQRFAFIWQHLTRPDSLGGG